MNDDSMTFEIFPHSVRPKRNFKKDLERAILHRTTYSISNIKLPEMKHIEGQFKPLKYRDAIKNSDSLDYDPNNGLDKQMAQKQESAVDRDLVLRNIRSFLLKSGIKMKGVSVEMIDAIESFENINILSI